MGIDPQSLDSQRDQREHDIQHRQPSRGGSQVAYDESRTAVRDLTPGTPLLTSDGKQYATVNETHGGYMSIDRPGDSGPFWLSLSYVVSNDGDRAYLSIPESEVEQHRLNQPGMEVVDRSLTRTGTLDETAEEALRTRERMERELLEQRGTIDTGLKRDGDFR